MKKIILTIAVLSGLTAATYAQTTVVVWGDNFDNDALGSYGQVGWNYNGTVGSPASNIETNNPEGTNTQNWALTFVSADGYNAGIQTPWMAVNGLDTSSTLADYTLEFDLALQGTTLSDLGGYVAPAFFLFDNWAEPYWGGNGSSTNVSASFFPNAGAGYQHYSLPLSAWVAEAGSSEFTPIPPNGQIAFGISFYMAGTTAENEEIDIENLQLLMNTVPIIYPNPTLTVQPAKPGLRVFAQDATETYNQEGFGTVDSEQSWVGVATPENPVSYSVAFQDFNTVNGFSFYYEMLQGDYSDGALNPYIVYYGTNELQLTITAGSPFTWSLDYKINAPRGAAANNVIHGTSATAVGTWTLTFSNDLAGAVIPPGGPAAPFTLASEDLATNFENPLVICFGEAPNSPGGYGQYFDISQISISGVIDGDEIDDFTTDASLNLDMWNPAFSFSSTNAVVQVSTNTPFWANWTTPALNGALSYGLETTANLSNPNWIQATSWNYTPLLIPPTRMGTSLIWTLVPNTCLPTADGGVYEYGTNNAPSAFFMLENPPTTP